MHLNAKFQKFLFSIFFILIFAVQVKAAEEILRFDSIITVHQDSSIIVEENITVRAEGSKIKRGIYRDFPIIYRDRRGNRYKVGFEILGVLRDGKSESYHTKNLRNGKRVYFGRKDYFLLNGEYTYTFKYRTNRQLGFFEKHDEVYWNVTGNGWDFPILNASAEVRLPFTIPKDAVSYDGYTGSQGSVAKNFEVEKDEVGNLIFETTRKLNRREGLTIVVVFPKGYVKEPTVIKNLAYFFRDNIGYIAALGSFAIVFLYYLFQWNIHGKDPKKGTIIPYFKPPEGFSPAVMRYVHNFGYDKKAFTSTVINLAVRGHLRIEESDGILFLPGSFTLLRTNKNNDLLSKREKKLIKDLFGVSSSIELKNNNHHIIQRAIHELEKGIDKEYAKLYFLTNSNVILPGFLFSVFGLIIPFFVISIGKSNMIFFIIYVVLLLFLNILFYNLMKAPTVLGRRVMDKIEGFKMYLEVGEKDRLNIINPPEKTTELFEEYLPYALALDVEHAWSEKFAGVLKKATESGEYQPTWYHGSNYSNFTTSSGISSFSNSFSSAISSSSTPPGSSSGSGGGGSSGGGGGGGGGGGW